MANKKKILIYERNEPDIRLIFDLICGYAEKVFIATNEEEFEEIIANDKPDIIIIDLLLGDAIDQILLLNSANDNNIIIGTTTEISNYGHLVIDGVKEIVIKPLNIAEFRENIIKRYINDS